MLSCISIGNGLCRSGLGMLISSFHPEHVPSLTVVHGILDLIAPYLKFIKCSGMLWD